MLARDAFRRPDLASAPLGSIPSTIPDFRAEAAAPVPEVQVPLSTNWRSMARRWSNPPAFHRGALRPTSRISRRKLTCKLERRPKSKLALIWQDPRLSATGLHDPFTELGGRSLQLVSLHFSPSGASLEPCSDSLTCSNCPPSRRQAARIDGSNAPLPRPAYGHIGTTWGRAVAIIGMALRVPGASDPGTSWANLAGGVESNSQLSGLGITRKTSTSRDTSPPRE